MIKFVGVVSALIFALAAVKILKHWS